MHMPIDVDISSLSKDELLSLLNAVSRENDELTSERASLRAERDFCIAELDKLRALVAQQNRALYGPKSERFDPDQLQLGIEDMEQSIGTAEAAEEERQKKKPEDERKPRPPRNNNRGALPDHLPQDHVTIEPEDKNCPDCGAEMHVIGEDVTKQLDHVPAQLKVRVIHRPRYGCRCCECAPVQAPAPERPITGGMATEALLAHVLVSKYGDHLPLYRQCQIFARQGIKLDRATLANWVGRTCWWLSPLQQLVLDHVLAATKIFADDTTVPVLDPGRGRTKTGRLWAYARDDRPWQGALPPAVAYLYSEDRKGKHPISHLAGFKGVLQCDGYSSFFTLAKERPDGDVTIAQCWAHLRRRFFEIHKQLQAMVDEKQGRRPPKKTSLTPVDRLADMPIATEALCRIAALYAVEEEIRGKTADDRRAARQARSKPLVDDLHAWFMARLAEVAGKSKLAEAIRYGLGHWAGLCVFLDDGRVEMDTNTVERTIRPIKLTKKNALFAGGDGGGRSWATVATLIESCRLNGVEPYAYLKDILERMVAGHPNNRLAELLPWTWKTLYAPGLKPSAV
jgi:transposase